MVRHGPRPMAHGSRTYKGTRKGLVFEIVVKVQRVEPTDLSAEASSPLPVIIRNINAPSCH